MIKRKLESSIKNLLNTGKAIILMGARQTGKTTLLRNFFEGNPDAIWFNADETDVQMLFDQVSSTSLKALVAGKKLIIIDEAQRIKNIGIKLKLITDTIKDVQLVATGSSAFELANEINEPLTGRKWEFQLYPLSFSELVNHYGLLEEKRMLHHRLVYGCYPEVVTSPGNEKKVLQQLTDSYLYKDILMWKGIKKPEKLVKLLRSLAFQLGNEMSYHELGQMVALDNETVEKYIQLLEQTYVIFRLGSFSRNLRKELKSKRKIYFYDNGIRNALIAGFSQPALRTDIGALWENFMICERQKYLHYNDIWTNCYFWRTHDQQEIDYLEENNGKLCVFEFKWNPKRKARLSKTFSKTYPNNTFNIITPENYDGFLLMNDKI